jgi:hypothetical protein
MVDILLINLIEPDLQDDNMATVTANTSFNDCSPGACK